MHDGRGGGGRAGRAGQRPGGRCTLILQMQSKNQGTGGALVPGDVPGRLDVNDLLRQRQRRRRQRRGGGRARGGGARVGGHAVRLGDPGSDAREAPDPTHAPLSRDNDRLDRFAPPRPTRARRGAAGPRPTPHPEQNDAENFRGSAARASLLRRGPDRATQSRPRLPEIIRERRRVLRHWATANGGPEGVPRTITVRQGEHFFDLI